MCFAKTKPSSQNYDCLRCKVVNSCVRKYNEAKDREKIDLFKTLSSIRQEQIKNNMLPKKIYNAQAGVFRQRRYRK